MSELLFGRNGQRVFLVLLAHVIVTWALLLGFPGTPLPVAYFWGVLLAGAVRLFGTKPRYEQGYRAWMPYATFLFPIALVITLTVVFWDAGCQFAAVAHKMREHLGKILDVGGDFGFQIVFVLVMAIICLTGHIWLNEKK